MRSSIARPAAVPTRILLVDDNQSGLSARRVVLEELGYITAGTTCPKEALTIFRAQPFDLVITDFRMPEMDGDAFIRELRQTRPDVPIILISGFVDALGLCEQSTGADAVIMKSNHEVPHLVRAATRLLSPNSRRKPPGGEGGAAKAKRRGLGPS